MKVVSSEERVASMTKKFPRAIDPNRYPLPATHFSLLPP
jgi:hypothetical protein